MVDGAVWLVRVGGLGFLVQELVDHRGMIAELGRTGAVRLFFGPGRRVRFPAGVEWRIKARTQGPYIAPMIVAGRSPVATTAPLRGRRSYGINGKDFGYTMMPLGRVGFARSWEWGLRRHDVDVAVLDRDEVLRPIEPVPIAAVLLAFTLAAHGIAGESKVVPERD